MRQTAPLPSSPVGKADTGEVDDMLKLPGAGMLIPAEKGFFLARAANGAATFEPVGKVDTGQVDDMLKLPGGRQSRHRLGVRHPRVPWGGDADPGR